MTGDATDEIYELALQSNDPSDNGSIWLARIQKETRSLATVDQSNHVFSLLNQSLKRLPFTPPVIGCKFRCYDEHNVIIDYVVGLVASSDQLTALYKSIVPRMPNNLPLALK